MRTMGSTWVLCAFLATAGVGLASAATDKEWVRESPGQRAVYDAKGDLSRVEVDEDRDGRFETVDTYREGTRVSRKEDADGDGVWERRFEWQPDGAALCVEDAGSGPVRRTHYAPDGTVARVEEDAERDGSFEAVWTYRGGLLERLEKPGGVWIYQQGTLARAEIDGNRDGKTDRVETYGPGGTIREASELTATGQVRARWQYGPDGQPTEVLEDEDGDGRCECARRYQAGGKVVRTVDRDGDGTPEIRETYAADGSLIAREEDLDGDGTFDIREGRQ